MSCAHGAAGRWGGRPLVALWSGGSRRQAEGTESRTRAERTQGGCAGWEWGFGISLLFPAMLPCRSPVPRQQGPDQGCFQPVFQTLRSLLLQYLISAVGRNNKLNPTFGFERLGPPHRKSISLNMN